MHARTHESRMSSGLHTCTMLLHTFLHMHIHRHKRDTSTHDTYTYYTHANAYSRLQQSSSGTSHTHATQARDVAHCPPHTYCRAPQMATTLRSYKLNCTLTLHASKPPRGAMREHPVNCTLKETHARTFCHPRISAPKLFPSIFL